MRKGSSQSKFEAPTSETNSPAPIEAEMPARASTGPLAA
jgi:hypothetical protein